MAFIERNYWIVTSLVFLVWTLFLGTVVIRQVRNQRRTRKAASEGGLSPGDSISGQVDGQLYSYEYNVGTRNSPPKFEVRISSPAFASFAIRRENWFDRLGKFLGLALEIHTGDAKFDETYYVESDAPRITETQLGDERVREAMASILSLGFTSVSHRDQQLIAQWKPFQPKAAFTQAIHQNAAGALALLNRSLVHAPFDAQSETAARVRRESIRKTSMIVAIAIAVTGVISVVLGMNIYQPVEELRFLAYSLRYATPALIVALAATFKAFAGTSTGHRDATKCGGLLFVGLPCLVFGTLMFFNARHDNGLPTERSALVAQKRSERRGKSNGRRYYARVYSWVDPQDYEQFSLNQREYDSIVPGRTELIIKTRPGRLGYEWRVSHHIKPGT